jgi:hypothetical protein
MTDEPTHGWTKLGHAVHASTIDHHPSDTAYQRFNKAVALFITTKVMTMSFFWMANLLALCSLPAILNQFAVFKGAFPSWAVTASLIALIAWISSNWLQLVFLPAIGVGQNLQSVAADARAAKTFEDTERIVDLLDVHTQGGLAEVLAAIQRLEPHTSSSGGSGVC